MKRKQKKLRKKLQDKIKYRGKTYTLIGQHKTLVEANTSAKRFRTPSWRNKALVRRGRYFYGVYIKPV